RPPAFVPPWSTPSGLPGYLNGPAPIADVPAPEAAATGNAVAEGGRTLTMHVSPAQEGHVLSVWTNGASVIDAAIDGRPVKINTAPRASGDTAWSLDYINAPASGATLTLTLKGTQPLTVAVVDRFSGLPGFPGKSFGSRPTSVVQIQTGDQTVVRRTYVF
ncbi:MAG: hypothetical protein NTY02_07500, partial [Acidobacteria bacterium]|nr:hypothetical protein [Acidobacteriota bacterium]